MPERVLARLVNIELMVRMLYEGNTQAHSAEARNQLLDQCRLASTGIPGEPEDPHIIIPIRCIFRKSVFPIQASRDTLAV